MNYECQDCEREEYITKSDLVSYCPGNGYSYESPGYTECAYCEWMVCADCEEKEHHNDKGKCLRRSYETREEANNNERRA